MSLQQPHRTRLWWYGREVHFVRWTENTLVFAWRDTDDTAMHIPRGAVVRLVERGVIGIEGARPTWLRDVIAPDVSRSLTLSPAASRAPRRTPAPARPTPPPARGAALERPPFPPEMPRSAYPPPVPAVSLTPPPAPALVDAPKSRLNIITRLIRKLGGDPARARA